MADNGAGTYAIITVGGHLVASNTLRAVAAELEVDTTTIRDWARHAPWGMNVVVVTSQYIARRDGEVVRGSCDKVAREIGSTKVQVCEAAVRRHYTRGWSIKRLEARIVHCDMERLEEARKSLLRERYGDGAPNLMPLIADNERSHRG